MELNEAIVYAKDKNPIIGLLLIIGLDNRILARGLRRIMDEKPHLRLFIYNKDAHNHIFRYLSHQDGMVFLSDYIQSNLPASVLENTFERATPYRAAAFSDTDKHVPSQQSPASTMDFFQPPLPLSNANSSTIESTHDDGTSRTTKPT